jgi:hypothetical protein
MPCSRMEPTGVERHRWGKPTGRNERERMSQSFRSLDATLFLPQLGKKAELFGERPTVADAASLI